jgi:hypothetical protein
MDIDPRVARHYDVIDEGDRLAEPAGRFRVERSEAGPCRRRTRAWTAYC